jgi:hypothetical protein
MFHFFDKKVVAQSIGLVHDAVNAHKRLHIRVEHALFATRRLCDKQLFAVMEFVTLNLTKISTTEYNTLKEFTNECVVVSKINRIPKREITRELRKEPRIWLEVQVVYDAIEELSGRELADEFLSRITEDNALLNMSSMLKKQWFAVNYRQPLTKDVSDKALVIFGNLLKYGALDELKQNTQFA